MTQLGAIAGAKLRMSGHAVASVRRHSRLKVAVVSVSALLLWVGALAFSRFAFRWLDELGGELIAGSSLSLSQVVMGRLLSLFGLALFVMLLFSNVLVSFTTLYRSREVHRLVVSPVSWRLVFLARFAESVSFSSWASAFLGSPILIAYGLETGAAAGFYVAALAFYFPFVTIPAALGAMVTLVLVRLVATVPRGGLLAAGAAAVTAVFVIFRRQLAAPDLMQALPLPALLAALGQADNPLLPSAWAARGVLAAAVGGLGEAGFYFLVLTANALFVTWLACELAERLFYPGWSALLGSPRDRRKPAGGGLLCRVERWLPRRLPPPLRALVMKDLRTFWRDPGQWSQFALFFGIMALYVATMRQGSAAYAADLWQSWVTLLNVFACLLILSTLTSRFVFPLISLEGRRWWILGLAPVTMRGIVWQKFWLSVGCTSVITVGLVVVSNLRLGLDAGAFAFTLAAVCAANVALAGLGVGLGSLYPNFEEDNPARIVSGMGGTLNFVCSVAYVVIVAVALTVLLQWRFLARRLDAGEGSFPLVAASVMAFIALVTVIAAGVPMWLGLRNLEQGEY